MNYGFTALKIILKSWYSAVIFSNLADFNSLRIDMQLFTDSHRFRLIHRTCVAATAANIPFMKL